MKKLLLAALLAGLAGTSAAQVSLTGKLGTTVDRTEVGATTTKGFVNDPTSNFAITARENLGNGIGFKAVVETSLYGNTFGGDDTRLGDRQKTVGFTAKNVGADFGRSAHSHFLNITMHDPFQTVYGSVAGDVHPLHGLRMSNGVFAHAHIGKNATVNFERTQGEPVETTVVSASGKFGPVSAMVSQYEQGATKSVVLSAQAKVVGNTLSLTHSDNQGQTSSKGTTLNAMRDVGPMTVKASYGKTNTDVVAYAIGADYNFSKRTKAGVAYRNVDRSNSLGDISQVGVGITHTF